MGLTINHIRADILNLATSGSNPIGFKISDNQIYYWVNQTRAMLISQDIQKRREISDIWVQNITCLDLEEVDKSECCEVTTNCKLLRTSLTIPKTIETHSRNGIIRVLKTNGDSISEVGHGESKYTKYTKYGKKSAKWYLKNNYIYIVDDDMLENISVYGIFDDPTSLSAYAACDGSTCYSIDNDYPCSLKMASDITNIVLKTKILPFLQIPSDTTNNAASDPESNNVKIK